MELGTRVLVTGAGGFIGSRLVERLLESAGGVSITSFIRSQKQKADPMVDTVIGDLTDPQSLDFSREFDLVYHLASLTPLERDKEKLRRVNYDGTRNLFNAVKDKTKSFVYVSGLAVFSPGENGTIDESSPKNPDTEFVRIRMEAEEFLRGSCKDNGIDFTVVYLPDIVYGNRGYFRSMFLEGIRDSKFRVPGSGDYVKNFIHLDDAADILIAVAAKDAANQKYIATDSHPAPFREFVDFVADHIGAKRPGTAPVFLARAAVGSELIKMLTRSARASNEKIRKIHEFKYPSYKEGVLKVASEFKSC